MTGTHGAVSTPVQVTLCVLIGGNGPTVTDRVLEYGDGWIPGVQKDLDELQRRIAELRTRAVEMGKPRPYVARVYARIDRFERYAEMDVDHVIVGIDPQAGTEEAMEEIDRVAQAAQAIG